MKKTARSRFFTAEDVLKAERKAFRQEKTRWPQAVILFPAPYPAAVANLGFLTIWEMLNSVEGFYCDRAVWDPGNPIEPTGIDTGLPLASFPLVFISSSFELDLISVIDSFLASGIEPEASKRAESDPIVVGGGISLTLNPTPWSFLLDAAIIGEGENAVLQWVDTYLQWRNSNKSKTDLLERSDDLPFVWIPKIQDRRVLPAEYGEYSESPAQSTVVHPEGHFGDCWLIELTRGCPRNCQFCGVCRVYAPRFAESDAVIVAFEESNALDAPKVGLVGAAVGDHPKLKDIVRAVTASGHEITVSSLRIEKSDEELLELLAAGGMRTLTVAPEAATENLRLKIGKKSTDEDLLALLKTTEHVGFKRVRMYFLIGTPEPEPSAALVDLAKKLRQETPRSLKLDLSVSTFIPKPRTPWEASPFAPLREIDSTKKTLREAIRRLPGVTIRFESTRNEKLSAMLSRGDDQLGRALLQARKARRPLEQELKVAGLSPQMYLEPDYRHAQSPWHFLT